MTKGYAFGYEGMYGYQVFCSPPEAPVATNLDYVAMPKAVSHLINKRKVQVSQKSLVARFMALDPDVNAAFEEMVGQFVHEYELTTEDAEARAFVQVMDHIRT